MTLPSHTQVILGPPGTGKTSTLLGLIEDELESGTQPESIGFFTFTKKEQSIDSILVIKNYLSLERYIH